MPRCIAVLRPLIFLRGCIRRLADNSPAYVFTNRDEQKRVLTGKIKQSTDDDFAALLESAKGDSQKFFFLKKLRSIHDTESAEAARVAAEAAAAAQAQAEQEAEALAQSEAAAAADAQERRTLGLAPALQHDASALVAKVLAEIQYVEPEPEPEAAPEPKAKRAISIFGHAMD
eukprot:COSAG01_NODE_129_length_24935_cov_39.324368_5_plen_173_part_00